MHLLNKLALLLFVYSLPLTAYGQGAALRASLAPGPSCEDRTLSTYLLGPDDQIEISGPELADFLSKPARVDGSGDVQVPLVGRIHVAELTPRQAEKVIDRALGAYIRDPQVAVHVSEVRSQPVSILGAVNSPGVHQVQGHKTLLEMLSLAGGIRQDAGYSIRITRQIAWGCLPVDGAKLDASGKFRVAELPLKKIMEARDPAENIQILPHDVITVPKADMVYVIGEVRRSGGFVLGEHQTMSVLQALSLTEGINPGADTKHAKILRTASNADHREEIPVDIKELFKGKTKDITMQADDILFVPGSAGRKAARRTLEAALQAGTGIAIWRVP